MGRALEQIAHERGHKVVQIIEIGEEQKFKSPQFLNSDVAIEFTSPDSADNNFNLCLNAGIRLVSGTTGWSMDIEKYKNLCSKNNTAFFYAPNFSIGVNILFEINRKLAELLKSFPDYNASIEETHHIHKLDKPSGTAIAIANDIIKQNAKYTDWKNEKKEDANILAVKSVREGEIIGQHTVKWENEIDNIKIEHTAKNRKGFTLGAMLAAEFIKNKTGVFTMKDLLNI